MPRGRKVVALAERGAGTDAASLTREFFEAFKAGRGMHARPEAVERLRVAATACRAGGVMPWRELRGAHGAATDVALTVAGKLVGEGLTVIWREQLRDLRASLGHADAPHIEKLLIEHAALCWLRLAVMELQFSALSSDNALKAVEHYEKRLTMAQKRFTRAVERLARVRKLKLPAMQINVAAEGGRQVNVA